MSTFSKQISELSQLAHKEYSLENFDEINNIEKELEKENEYD